MRNKIKFRVMSSPGIKRTVHIEIINTSVKNMLLIKGLRNNATNFVITQLLKLGTYEVLTEQEI